MVGAGHNGCCRGGSWHRQCRCRWRRLSRASAVSQLTVRIGAPAAHRTRAAERTRVAETRRHLCGGATWHRDRGWRGDAADGDAHLVRTVEAPAHECSIGDGTGVIATGRDGGGGNPAGHRDRAGRGGCVCTDDAELTRRIAPPTRHRASGEQGARVIDSGRQRGRGGSGGRCSVQGGRRDAGRCNQQRQRNQCSPQRGRRRCLRGGSTGRHSMYPTMSMT